MRPEKSRRSSARYREAAGRPPACDEGNLRHVGRDEDKEVLGSELAGLVELTPQELGDACHYLEGEGLIEEAMPDMGAGPYRTGSTSLMRVSRRLNSRLKPRPSRPSTFLRPSRS